MRHHPAIRCRIVRALERFEVAPVEWLHLVRTMRRQRDQCDAVASAELNLGERLVAVMPVKDNELRRVDRRVRCLDEMFQPSDEEPIVSPPVVAATPD